MSAGQESGSPIRENRTLLPAPLPPDEARGTLAAAAGVSTVGLRPPFDTPQRHSHPVCRAILTLIVALEGGRLRPRDSDNQDENAPPLSLRSEGTARTKERLRRRTEYFSPSMARGAERAGIAIGGAASGAVFEPPARVAGLDDIAMVRQPVEHGGGHFGVAEHLRPVGEGEVCGDQ